MPDACIDVGLFEKTGGQKLPKSGENSSCGAFRYLLRRERECLTCPNSGYRDPVRYKTSFWTNVLWPKTMRH